MNDNNSVPQRVLIPDSHLDLVEKPLIVILGMIGPDGLPRLTPVWFNYEPGYLYFNSGPSSAKDRILRSKPAITALIIDPTNAFRYVQLRGIVDEITHDDAQAHNMMLYQRYLGCKPENTAQQRARYRLAIHAVIVH